MESIVDSELGKPCHCNGWHRSGNWIVVGGYLLGANLLQGVILAKVALLVGITLAAPIVFVTFKKLRRPLFTETNKKAIAQLLREQKLWQKMVVLQGKLE